MMDPDLKARWVAALRGGKYRQGTSMLRNAYEGENPSENLFCCMGVLCDVFDVTKWDRYGNYAGETEYPPKFVAPELFDSLTGASRVKFFRL